MISRANIICLLALLTGFTLHGQETITDKGARVLVSVTRGMDNVTFHIYNPSFPARAIYKDTLEAVNRFPEQLMSSAISTLSQEWIYYNTLGRREKAVQKQQAYFDYIRSMDKDRNYFELRSKLMFQLNSEEYAIVKFYFHSLELEQPQAGAYLMQKINNRWYLTSSTSLTDVALMVMRFQEEKFLQLLQARSIGVPRMDDLIKIVAPDNAIDFTILYHEFSKWYDGNERENIEYFIDKDTW